MMTHNDVAKHNRNVIAMSVSTSTMVENGEIVTRRYVNGQVVSVSRVLASPMMLASKGMVRA